MTGYPLCPVRAPTTTERLEDLVWIDDQGQPGRLDMCECERLLQCPNGTVSAIGSKDIYSCEVHTLS